MIDQMDVKTVFLNVGVEEEIYIEKHEGFETLNWETHVCRLKISLYGVMQAACSWYTHKYSHLSGLGFIKSDENENIYYILVDHNMLSLLLYVYDE